MKGVRPELVTGASVIVGRRRYPVEQVGQGITRQDPRDFTAGEVVRAMTPLGSTLLQTASALLGGTGPVAV
ncbi:SCO5918 family protein [Streptomyces sp. NPDC046727]|uniref:SCO5918 family protein n=1 Tax=Streptomyces sp. NPDC046727 TaxID=3155373 RepID=UPI0033D61B98